MYHHLTLTGVKGRIQTRDVELDDETHKKYVEVIFEFHEDFLFNLKKVLELYKIEYKDVRRYCRNDS